MSNYDNPQLRYSCFSEPSLVSHSHPRSLSLTDKSHFEKNVITNFVSKYQCRAILTDIFNMR